MVYTRQIGQEISKFLREKDPKISVIIPVLNDQDRIRDCLKAVFSQTLPPYEVIVVDGHSKDETVNNARNFQVGVVYEDFGTVGGARQVGVEEAQGDYIAFTDSDCIPQKDWLENLVCEFDEGIVAVGGGIKNIGKGLWEESIALVLDTYLGSANSVQDRVLKGRREVNSISGCNSIYRKSDVEVVGGFDVGLSINEDTELNRRLLNLGKIIYTPNAIVLHNQARTLSAFIKRMVFFGYGRGFNRLWDVQVIPPIAAVGVMILGIIIPSMFYVMILLYVCVVSIFTLSILIKVKKPRYLISIPIVYILEHTSYVFGFWKGTIITLTQSNILLE